MKFGLDGTFDTQEVRTMDRKTVGHSGRIARTSKADNQDGRTTYARSIGTGQKSRTISSDERTDFSREATPSAMMDKKPGQTGRTIRSIQTTKVWTISTGSKIATNHLDNTNRAKAKSGHGFEPLNVV